MIYAALLVTLLVAALVTALLRAVRTMRRGDAAVMRRLGPALGGLAAAGGLFALIGGVDTGGAIVGATGVIVVGPLLGYLLSRGRRGRTVERPWSGAVTPAIPADFAGRAGVPKPWSVARALGRVEARELSSSVWFGVGIGFCVLMYVIFGFVYSADNTQSWAEYIQISPWFAHPLVGMCVLAGHRAATRARRDGADELVESCPADPTTRTVGFLLAAAVPLATLSLFLTALFVTSAVRSPGLHGPIGGDAVADALAAVALGAGGVALGVALGLWVRFALAPVVAVVAVALATSGINGVGGGDWNPLVPLATAPTVEGPSAVFEDRPTLWHLVWVVGLIALVTFVALARHRRDRSIALFGAAAAAVVLVAGIGATRPLSPGSAERIAALTVNPEAFQRCESVDAGVRVCVFDLHHELLDPFVERVRPVAAAFPAGLPPLTLRQVFDGDLVDLRPEVRRLVTERDLERPTGEVRLDFGSDESGYVIGDLGFRLAFEALGLPTEPDDDLLPTIVAGEARGVVALWLATRGLDADETSEASTAVEPASPDSFARGSLEIGDCSEPAVVWSAQDLAAARALIALPEAEVTKVVHAGWDRWANPRTGTDELLAALGLPAVGPFDHVVPQPGNPC